MRPVQENDVFHAIAHPARRAILLALKQGERPASELAAPFKMSFAAISQHLRTLEEAELVAARRDGRHRIYRLRDGPLREVFEFAAYFEERLDALGDYLDRVAVSETADRAPTPPAPRAPRGSPGSRGGAGTRRRP